MMVILVWGFLCYLGTGFALQVETRDIRLRARLLGCFVWPWILCIDGTPRIRPFLRWARGEIVIEASEWPLGVERLTIRRRDGSEYAEAMW